MFATSSRLANRRMIEVGRPSSTSFDSICVGEKSLPSLVCIPGALKSDKMIAGYAVGTLRAVG
jgi:hypothetical protein